MLSRLPLFLRQHLAAVRTLLVLTVLTGLVYPLMVTGIVQLPGLQHRANGSLIKTANGQMVGSALVGQNFTDGNGNPISRYFQTRPSAAGENGYDPTATAASNLGPEQIIDTLPDPKVKDDTGTPGLLTLVCGRSVAVGKLEKVNGQRPYCTGDGVGAVLSVIRKNGLTGPVQRVVSVNQPCPAKPFLASYHGVPVQCARYGVDYRVGDIVLVKGPGRGKDNPVPADAVTASGSGLDPNISVSYAHLQVGRVARARSLNPAVVRRLVDTYTTGRSLGFLGEPAVNVLRLNLALDQLARRGAR